MRNQLELVFESDDAGVVWLGKRSLSIVASSQRVEHVSNASISGEYEPKLRHCPPSDLILEMDRLMESHATREKER